MQRSTNLPVRDRATLWDRIGIALSGLCLVHCLFVPVLLALLPLWPAGEAMHAWMHPVLAVVLIPTTTLAMHNAWKRHGQTSIVLHLAAGLVVILAAGFLGHAVPGEWTETAVTLAGSGLLISGHWRNYRHCRACHVHHHLEAEVTNTEATDAPTTSVIHHAAA